MRWRPLDAFRVRSRTFRSPKGLRRIVHDANGAGPLIATIIRRCWIDDPSQKEDLQEEIAFGQRFDLRSRQWSKADAFELAFSYAPLTYFLGRYRQGAQFLETSLDFWLRGKKVEIFDILSRVYNGEIEPSNRCRVTLSHFYARLGRDLRQWRGWRAFVNGF